MGLSLGLVGAGGSILTVPLLVYGFGISPQSATGAAFVVVGILSAIGTATSAWQKNIDYKTLLIFSPISLTVAILSRTLFFQFVPKTVFGFEIDKLLMSAFAALMILAAYAMTRPVDEKKVQIAPWKVVVSAVIVGALSGILGAGGGFLIIPALVLGLGLSLPMALGTSLGIITINCLAGISSDVMGGRTYPWPTIWSVTSVALLGMVVGILVRSKLKVPQLKQAFAVTVILTAIFVLIQEWK